MKRAAFAAFGTAVGLLTFCALPAIGAEDDCPPIGQILDARRYEGVRVVTKGHPAGTFALPNQLLYRGDILEIREGHQATIEDRPGAPPRVLRDGSHEIRSDAPCDLDASFWGKFPTLLTIGLALFTPSTPVQSVTMPLSDALIDSADCAPPTMPFSSPQRVSRRTGYLAALWRGCVKRVVVSDGNGKIFAERSLENRVQSVVIGLPPDWPPKSGHAELWVTDGSVWAKQNLTIVAAGAAPLPPGVDRPWTALSSSERAVAALWLALEGPAEWRLQGWSMVEQATERDYLAWKAWTGARAGKAFMAD